MWYIDICITLWGVYRVSFSPGEKTRLDRKTYPSPAIIFLLFLSYKKPHRPPPSLPQLYLEYPMFGDSKCLSFSGCTSNIIFIRENPSKTTTSLSCFFT